MVDVKKQDVFGQQVVKFDHYTLSDFKCAAQKEWLISNGLGGYSSSSIIGCNTRRHHGLLVSCLNPGFNRIVYLSKCDETLLIGKLRYDLFSNQYVDLVHPEGFRYLQEFSMDPFPRFIYKIKDAILQKDIFILDREDTVFINYKLLNSDSGQACCMHLRPLVPVRSFDSVMYENESYDTHCKIETDVVTMKPYQEYPEFYMIHNADNFEVSKQWMHNFKYSKDADFEVQKHEDIFSPGVFTYILREGESCFFGCSLSRKSVKDTEELFRTYSNFYKKSRPRIENAPELVSTLAYSQHGFVIANQNNVSLPIGGYHWVGQNTREMLISMTGLLLIPGRIDVARNIFKELAGFCDMGFIPAQLESESPEMFEYSSVDVPLWFFYALGKYLQYTNDFDFVKDNLLNSLLNVFDCYSKGTRYGMGMDQDSLISCYEKAFPLTWMDQCLNKKDGFRWGKLVEINALWYNALKVMESIVKRFDKKLENDYSCLAYQVQDSFNRVFWNPHGEYLYDELHDNGHIDEFRVNQIFAFSLTYPVLQKKHFAKVIESVRKKLYTPFGMKPYADSSVCFPWLNAHFFGAYFDFMGSELNRAQDPLYKDFYAHINDNVKHSAAGSIPESFKIEGNSFFPSGCMSYSLSTAEFIRIWVEYLSHK